jgi:rare lipoprotein A
MSFSAKTSTSLLALLGLLALFAGPVAAASAAGTGGASAPPTAAPATAAPAPAKPKLHTTGIATWFGPGFYGKKTACGQTMTPALVGVANRTLPCGTLVKVSYRGHLLTLPVIDRGPYSHIGADWDLTTGAAQTLGIEDTVRIGTRIVGSAPNTPALGLVPGPPAPPASTASGGAVAG